jgi:glycosyltransferase involved in cell wall biosynthesis
MQKHFYPMALLKNIGLERCQFFKTFDLRSRNPLSSTILSNTAKRDNLMKVVHIFKDCYPPVTGGIEQHMNLLCRWLARTIDVAILAPSRSLRRTEQRLENVRIIRIPEFGRYASVPFCPTAPWELRSLRPNVSHLHFPNPMGDLTQLLGAANMPFVITYHADIIKQKAFVPLYRPVLRLLFKKARKIIFSAGENIPASPLLSAYQHKFAVIPFGVEIDCFRLRDGEDTEVEAVRRKLGGSIILFVGAARYYKGLDVLLRAMTAVKGNLVIAGRDTQDPSLKRTAADLDIADRVLFCGEVSPERLRILLNAADIFVLPSIDRCETFGIGQLEAMACSKPVVSTDLPTGVRSVNRHDQTGLVVPPGAPDELAGALNLLLSDPFLRSKFGSAARLLVEREFGVDRMVSRTIEVYREVLQ